MTPPDPDDTRPDAAGPDLTRPDTERSGDTGPAQGTPRDDPRPGLPDDVDAAFAAIVADWAAAGAPRWPDELPEPGTSARPDAAERGPRDDAGPSSGLGTATPPAGQELRPRGADGPPAAPAPRPESTPPPRAERPAPPEDEHYVPPEPPPLPRLGLSSLLGLGLLVVGVVLLAVPGLLGGPVGLGIVPGLLAMTAGLGWLVFGLRRGRDEGSAGSSDDGAVL